MPTIRAGSSTIQAPTWALFLCESARTDWGSLGFYRWFWLRILYTHGGCPS
jgi:hypothetical protein